jgi:hypothetical protein
MELKVVGKGLITVFNIMADGCMQSSCSHLATHFVKLKIKNKFELHIIFCKKCYDEFMELEDKLNFVFR